MEHFIRNGLDSIHTAIITFTRRHRKNMDPSQQDAHKVGGAQWNRLHEASRAEQLRTAGAKVFNAARPGWNRNVFLYLAMTGGAYLAYSYYSVLMAKSPYQAKLRPNLVHQYAEIVKDQEEHSPTRKLQTVDDRYSNPHAALNMAGSRIAEPLHDAATDIERPHFPGVKRMQ